MIDKGSRKISNMNIHLHKIKGIVINCMSTLCNKSICIGG